MEKLKKNRGVELVPRLLITMTDGVVHVSQVMVPKGQEFVDWYPEHDYDEELAFDGQGFDADVEAEVARGNLLREKRRRLGEIGFQHSKKDLRDSSNHGAQKPRYKGGRKGRQRHGRLPTSFVAHYLSS